jgi:hypothetical protein
MNLTSASLLYYINKVQLQLYHLFELANAIHYHTSEVMNLLSNSFYLLNIILNHIKNTYYTCKPHQKALL